MDDDPEQLDYYTPRPKRTLGEQARGIGVLILIMVAAWGLWHLLGTFLFGWGPSGMVWR